MTDVDLAPATMTVIVKNNVLACLPTGQVVINLSRQLPEQQEKKMELALSTFREYGWQIDDQRRQKGGIKKEPPRE